MLTFFYIVGAIATFLYFNREGLPDVEGLPPWVVLAGASFAWPLTLPLHYLGRKE
jgi:hypothetical protein